MNVNCFSGGLFASETPMGCGRNIVVACLANDRQTKAVGSGERAKVLFNLFR
jgi:hypothetical protein